MVKARDFLLFLLEQQYCRRILVLSGCGAVSKILKCRALPRISAAVNTDAQQFLKHKSPLICLWLTVPKLQLIVKVWD